ncbi:chemotaxis protein CheD [Paraglaciecola sp.]|uniref:chemotaxis protein CheD n=1 Tax=Paraglaciecola sp. TaxID=1920173 RepID=UPI0030F3BC0D
MSNNIINLNPSEFVHGKAISRQYQTILGSCVSVIFWHTDSQFFAMCHYVLPEVVQLSKTRQVDKIYMDNTGHFGSLILPYFHRLVLKAGLPVEEIQTQLYGGAGSLASLSLSAHFQVGLRNIEFAHLFLKEHGYSENLLDIGGHQGRKILFNTQTGHCNLVKLKALNT